MKPLRSDTIAIAGDFARREIASIRDEPINIFGLDLRWFDKSDNRRLASEAIKVCALANPIQMMTVIGWAQQGWGLAEEALRGLISEYIANGEQLPAELAAYNVELINRRPPKVRGQQKSDNFLRDIAISIVVQRVAEQFGLRPTGRSARHLSACAVVARALTETPGVTNLSEKGVAEIWRKYGNI